MGKQMVVKNGKSLKDQDACEDLVIKLEQPMDDVRIPVTEQKDLSTCVVLDPNTLFSDNNNPNVQPQTDDDFTAGLNHANLGKADYMFPNPEFMKHPQKNCNDYKPKKSQLTRRTIPSKQEVKEDLVKTEKKGNFVTEEVENPPYIYLINAIIGCFLLLALISYIKSVSTNYSSSSPHCRSFTEEEMKRNHKNPPFICFIYMIIGCFFFLKLISYIKSVSTNYKSPSPRFHAESCRSLDDGQTNSNLAPSPVSYPMRIAVSPSKAHQVFLNFRGEELRYNFVSHLSDAFQRHEIKFFIDQNEQRGKDRKHLFFRIEESSIGLAIFSTRYPESNWCMDELVKMKELADQGKLRVIPIFYKVEAEDVRKPTRDSEFGKNFWRLAEVSSGDQIKNWKEALECISNKLGLSLGNKSSESDFLKQIVKDVQSVIKEEENHGGDK